METVDGPVPMPPFCRTETIWWTIVLLCPWNRYPSPSPHFCWSVFIKWSMVSGRCGYYCHLVHLFAACHRVQPLLASSCGDTFSITKLNWSGFTRKISSVWAVVRARMQGCFSLSVWESQTVRPIRCDQRLALCCGSIEDWRVNGSNRNHMHVNVCEQSWTRGVVQKPSTAWDEGSIVRWEW